MPLNWIPYGISVQLQMIYQAKNAISDLRSKRVRISTNPTGSFYYKTVSRLFRDS